MGCLIQLNWACANHLNQYTKAAMQLEGRHLCWVRDGDSGAATLGAQAVVVGQGPPGSNWIGLESMDYNVLTCKPPRASWMRAL